MKVNSHLVRQEKIDWQTLISYFISVYDSFKLGILYLPSFCSSSFKICLSWDISGNKLSVLVSLHNNWAFPAVILFFFIFLSGCLLIFNLSFLLWVVSQHSFSIFVFCFHSVLQWCLLSHGLRSTGTSFCIKLTFLVMTSFLKNSDLTTWAWEYFCDWFLRNMRDSSKACTF